MKNTIIRGISAVFLTVFALCTLLFPWGGNYQSPFLWAHYPEDTDKPVDVFIVGATADWGDDNTYQTSTYLKNDRYFQRSLLAMQAGLYADSCNVYAPYYRQACLSVYYEPDEFRGQYLRFAYRDVREAFLWYLEHENDGRPFILAGYSQGADLALRLMQELFQDETLQKQLVAAYLIGWRVVEEDLVYPQIRMAQGESDTGVIVAFSSEADYVTGSIILPQGGYTYGINPLNWKTDDTIAPASQNPGACLIHMDGSTYEEIPGETGCYRSPTRGTIIPMDINSQDYPPKEDLFCDGCYHNYELNLYYRSVQKNVKTRIDAYFGA